MPENKVTLDGWMVLNRWTNTAMAKAITESGYSIGHSQISQIRNKKSRPSAKLALIIHDFVGEEVSLKELLGDDIA